MFKKIYVKHDRETNSIFVKRGIFGSWTQYIGYTETEAVNDFIQGLA